MYRYSSIKTKWRRTWLLSCILFVALTGNAQLEVGDNLKMTMTGDLGFGYNGSFGNADLQSTHSEGAIADANLNGYYFHPNFLSFNFRPYFNRNQANATSQNITRSTGFGGDIGLFGGSRFPGSISYGKDFSSNSEITIAGVPSLFSDSTGQAFGLSWSALIENLPQLHLNYTTGSSSASVSGLLGESDNASSTLTLGSTYQIAGFSLQAGITNSRNHFSTPSYLTPEPMETGGSSMTYSASAQHALPLRGSASVGWAHSSYTSEQGDHWTTSSYSGSASVTPIDRLSLTESVSYTNNLTGILQMSFGSAAIAEPVRFGLKTDSLYANSIATFRILRGLSASGYFNHRVQSLNGQDYSDSQYGGTLNYNYATPLFGFLSFGVGIVDTASKNGNDGTGLVANVGMSRKIRGWDASADFNYQQSIQTQLIFVTTSSYSYGATIRRRFNQDFQWGASARASHSGLVARDGDTSRAESFSSFLSWNRYNLGANYSQSQGAAVLSTNGTLIATPLGSVLTNDFLYFNARSYSATVGTVVGRRLSLSGGYSNVFSSTQQNIAGVSNNGESYSARVEYRLRKFAIAGGFARSRQSFSSLAGPPRVVNSFYLSFSRWFNVF